MSHEASVKSQSTTSPKNNKIGTSVEVPLHDTIPIIFIPGIMGSNIYNRNPDVNKAVWRLGNATIPIGTIISQGSKNPSQLQKELDPEYTIVDPSGEISVDPKLGLSKEILRERGWGTVHSASYGGILTYLQLILNNVVLDKDTRGHTSENGSSAGPAFKFNEGVKEWNSLLDKNNIQNWHPLNKPLVAIEKSEIEFLKNFSFPVYAMGYNWLKSNEDAANNISKQLDKIKNKLGQKFHKFIIVSHSMGGLVTRRLVQLNSADIAGVVHGVMPADGAAAAYRRLVAGSAEGGLESAVAAVIIGNKTEHVTAVLANSPGGLELLPNSVYNNNKPWLTLKGKNHLNQEIKVELPTKDKDNNIDPYEQIYKADNVWWEMVKPELIDPAGLNKKRFPKQKPKDIYKEKINQVKKFHNQIINKYHAHTYINYGHDLPSFGTLTWELEKPMTNLTKSQILTLPRASEDDINKHNKEVEKEALIMGSKGGQHIRINTKTNSGFRHIKLVNGKLLTFKISSQDSPGDGTVPWQSGSAPLRDKKNVKQVFMFMEINHQGSYGHKGLKQTVLYSIVKIIKDNNIKPKYR